MKTLRWMALLPFLVAGASACDDFGLATDPDGQQGELRWTLDGGDLFTKALSAEIPDTNDFLLSISDEQGALLYNGLYGDSPEYLPVKPGNYTVGVRSIAFSAPAFDRPQYGDEQVVMVSAGEKVSVALRCTLLNAGIRLRLSAGFLSAYPDGTLYVGQNGERLKYLYTEKRTAYVQAGDMSLTLYDGGQDRTLLTRRLSAREILTLGIHVADNDGLGNVQVHVDTAKVWTGGDLVIGETPSGEGDTPQAIPVGDVPAHVGEKGVWVHGYIVGGDLTSNGKSVKTSGFSKATHLALADRSSVTAKASCLAVELPKGEVRDALNLVDHPELVGKRVYVKGDLVSAYFNTRGLKNTSACRLE